ncbi:UNVERIFIED_CONTAM: putative mitochondrial protein [Sesamum radiatum]|uniref:Mitochondrial protein n=1 Tax=Sesamum radiatum TaxID=300843 RepID=A0AAW2MZJ0_SESRA
MKGIMDSIVSPSQSAFIPGRLITDNVLLAFELNHYLKASSWSNNASVALKLDMSKAYDRVEWPFLRYILLKLGFESRFVHLIMLLVTTVSYSLTLNGEHFGYFRPERGIRQGDPLSPYLFIFVAEAFSCMLQEAERRGGVQGVAVCAAAPKISHLLFADDTLLFCKVKGEKIEEIQHILTIYERASRQVVNFSKSNMVMSGRIGEEEKQRLANRLGVRVASAHDRYLGLPAVAGRSRHALFHNIQDRMWTRIADGIVAGKGVLIKPTRMGGLGFRSLKNFNLALVVKQGWRLLTQPNTMLSRVLKAKYFPHCSFWEALKGSRPSLTWRSLLATKEILREGCGVQNEEDAQDEASTSGSYPRLTEGGAEIWHQLWNIPVPPCVRLQAWRFCYEAVPTMENLARRRVGIEVHCVLCGADTESLKHILLECSFARLVWALSNIPWNRLSCWSDGSAAWLSNAIHKLDKEDRAKFLTVCWALWQNRNKKRMEDIEQDPRRVVHDAFLLLQKYQEARTKLKVGLL